MISSLSLNSKVRVRASSFKALSPKSFLSADEDDDDKDDDDDVIDSGGAPLANLIR